MAKEKRQKEISDSDKLNIALLIMNERMVGQYQEAVELMEQGVDLDHLPPHLFED